MSTNKDETMVYLFRRRWDKEEPPKEHDWKLIHCDPLKYYVEYQCRRCGDACAHYVYDISDHKGILQLLNFNAPKCK